jgi:hypothetical protein
VFRDLRFAVRNLNRHLWLSLTVVVTLTLGIGISAGVLASLMRRFCALSWTKTSTHSRSFTLLTPATRSVPQLREIQPSKTFLRFANAPILCARSRPGHNLRNQWEARAFRTATNVDPLEALRYE